MTFENQVKKAKEEKLKNRITRDLIFIVLGIVFLTISIFSAIKDKENNKEDVKKTTKKIITSINK